MDVYDDIRNCPVSVGQIRIHTNDCPVHGRKCVLSLVFDVSTDPPEYSSVPVAYASVVPSHVDLRGYKFVYAYHRQDTPIGITEVMFKPPALPVESEEEVYGFQRLIDFFFHRNTL